MRSQLFPGLLLVLFFSLSFVGTCLLPKLERLGPFFQTPPLPLSLPSEAAPIVHNPVVSHYTLKFERYSKWIDQSKSFWKLREDRQDVRDYVSPYLTKFEAKRKAGWWASLDLIRLWRYFLWETTLPEWLGGTDARTEEDFLLLRAMERPRYMSIEGQQEGISDVRHERESVLPFLRI